MGMSPMHASMVPLLLNPDTGAITAAFHVIFNDWFATVPADTLPAFDSDEWQCLFSDLTYQYILPDDEMPPDTNDIDSCSNTVAHAMDLITPPVPLDVPPPLLPTQVEQPVILSDQMPTLKPPW